ncbi:hypothetical protein FA95DRAFT_1385929 [Auriscalpium vulgare]|uniref:Uncharacterized protein n=1 Tax=Auriscalpium vulgare TaxID=40419 RepID=A0ACB8S743_9AGAM|nr:hypothetical protein FA95DRAFT_1385929 [Auriscalpium vulgare]
MEDLAWQYPAEPVERAALRFCEAIARWRGKPELETVRRRPECAASAHTPAVQEASARIGEWPCAVAGQRERRGAPCDRAVFCDAHIAAGPQACALGCGGGVGRQEAAMTWSGPGLGGRRVQWVRVDV